MLGDVAIMVFALISIFTKKRWAIITATIWFIVGFILGFTFDIFTSNLMYSDSAYDDTLTDFEKASLVLFSFEVLFIIVGWIRVLFNKDKKQVDSN